MVFTLDCYACQLPIHIRDMATLKNIHPSVYNIPAFVADRIINTKLPITYSYFDKNIPLCHNKPEKDSNYHLLT